MSVESLKGGQMVKLAAEEEGVLEAPFHHPLPFESTQVPQSRREGLPGYWCTLLVLFCDMFGLGRDPDLPQVTLWRDFEEPVRLPTVEPDDLRCVYPRYAWLRMEKISLHPGEISLIVSDPSPRAHAAASELNDGNNERSTSGVQHAFEVVHVNRNPERVRFEVEEDDSEDEEEESEVEEDERSEVQEDVIDRGPPYHERITWLHVFSFLPGFHPVVKVLLAHGADPNSVAHATSRRWDFTPLHIAATPETARLLLEYKAKVNVKNSNGCTPLLLATLNGRHSVVEVLLAHGADPNVPDDGGRSPLFIATEKGHLLVADVLFALGADPNVTDWFGHSPLFVATEKGHHEVVEVLLANGADPNVANCFEKSPLHEAASAETAELLIRKGAVVNAKDRCGKTPLSVATENNRHSVVEVLVANGADLNVADEDERSPLHRAKGREDVAKQLLSMGASRDIRNQKGQTACEIAIARGYGHIVSHFPNHIASGLSSKESRFDQEFDVLSRIGAGSFGEVYKAKKKETEELYAIKEIPLTGNRDEILRTFREVRAAVELRRSGSTVKCYDAWIEQELDDEQEDDLSCAEDESKGSGASWICFQEEETSGTSPEGNQLQPMNQPPKKNSRTPEQFEDEPSEQASQDKSSEQASNDVALVGAKRIRYGSKVDIYPLGLILVELLLPMTESERDELFDSNLLTTEVTIPDEVKEILNEEQRGLLVRMLSHEPERRPDAFDLREFW
ncbi:unnamed protein product [Cyprideis torosa]|uniref:Uncharacterized protein n=1 Tax=Cyprideis torosa TaxID=163714 RepID=A0A7R8ZRX8_9CRUS|nr:unnamed protein product [Cyprideis torosa]CAG0900193.1 unnamed protein product [Cyprideis torosa]